MKDIINIPDIKDMRHHPDSERIVQIMMDRAKNDNPAFFRLQLAYYWGVVASMMRGKIDTGDKGVIPINIYAIALAVSGSGKGVSTKLMKDEVISQFRSNFMQDTFQKMADINLPKLANDRAIRNGTDPDEELREYQKEFKSTGEYYWSFPDATLAAMQEVRHKLLLAGGGALNLQVDEIGRNLQKIADPLDAYLLMYDNGDMDPRLIKGNKDNLRREDIIGQTPANFMGFGAPEAALDDGPVQKLMGELWETGYGRRPFFCLQEEHTYAKVLTPKQEYDLNMAAKVDPFLEAISDRLGDMANVAYANKIIDIEEPVRLIFIAYEQRCRREAKELGSTESTLKTEMCHRYFKAMKLAGAYAWIDGDDVVTKANAYSAIKLTEESGDAFERITKKDEPWAKLAKHLAKTKRPMTHTGLISDLPFYRGPLRDRQEMLTLAIDYGYSHNIIIKKEIVSGIEFFTGSTIEPTDLNRMIISQSTQLAHQYLNEIAPWDSLHQLTQLKGHHWCAHHFDDQHRCVDKAIPGFNMLVLDVDKDVLLSTAKMLLEGYQALFYTTKSHRKIKDGVLQGDRFRILLPMNYTLKLNPKMHKQFWENVFKWLPFEVDHASAGIERKWESYPGSFEYVEGKLVDVLPFIPQTSKNVDYQEKLLTLDGVESLERWFIANTEDGDRNVMLHRYAMSLFDGGFDIGTIADRTLDLNSKLADPIKDFEEELSKTIMITIAKAFDKREEEIVSAA